MCWYMVFSGDLLIGWSRLEVADRMKATAFGSFVASHHYETLQPDFLACREDDQVLMGLYVVGEEGQVQAVSVHIADYSDHGEGIEIAVYGISDPPFDQLFPCS
ncbi:hypothetical protein [Dyella sp. C11]|uniref:hypothetical protein n=1 Tax=Dyella sp. C11 TaxID=2126991 RepID=UPI000D64F864|nr:hypothetical protein [Dyella sp. C11]